MSDTSTLANLRHAEFGALDDGTVYLNSASIGPLPARSIAALATCNADRGRPATWPIERLNAILGGARALAARLINAEATEIALMPNTTTGLNIAARALPLKAGDIVLTFDREFPANIYPWMRLDEKGVILERLAPTAAGWPDEARLHERLRDPRRPRGDGARSPSSATATRSISRRSRVRRARRTSGSSSMRFRVSARCRST